MSIALENHRIQRSGLRHGMSCGSVFESSSDSARPIAGIFAGERRLSEAKSVREEEEVGESSSSSSIGRNSDLSGGESDGEGEVQSSHKGALDTLDALEEVLPIKRGISNFYCGKSKSFTSLADVSSCSSIKEIVKPENAYTRKRKNLLAHSTFWDKNNNNPLRSNTGAISKKPANSNRNTFSMAGPMINFESSNNSESSDSNSSSPILCRPPLHPHSRRLPNNESPSSPPQHNFSPWRSFSLSDLQGAAAETPSITGFVISNVDKDELH